MYSLIQVIHVIIFIDFVKSAMTKCQKENKTTETPSNEKCSEAMQFISPIANQVECACDSGKACRFFLHEKLISMYNCKHGTSTYLNELWLTAA